MREYERNKNAVYSLNYHLIFVVKYRKKIFENEKILSRFKEIVKNKEQEYEIKIMELECGDDYVHILFSAKPTLKICDFVNKLKGNSSRILRSEFKSDLKDELYGDSLWSPSYFVSSTGNVSLDTLMDYVKEQREKA